MRRSFLTSTTGRHLGYFVVWMSAALAPAAHAVPMVFGSNAYEFVQVNLVTYATSSAAAAASTFNGVNGHLATITSQAENDFILGLVTAVFSGFNGAWLGGNFQGWLEGPEAGQTFVQAGGYTNWNQVEPNNSGLMYMSIGTFTPNTDAAGAGNWLDDSGVNGVPDASADPVMGYFIEYENAAATVPEPSTIGMLAAGLALLGIRRRIGC